MSLAAIHDIINNHFSFDEIHHLTFELGIDYDNLAGETKSRKIRSLITQLDNNQQLDQLKSLVLAKRSFITWPETATDSAPASVAPRQGGIHLTADDRSRLVRILATLPEFRDVRSRVRLIDDVFAAVPRGNDIVSLLDLDGPARAVASDVVNRLANFGQNASGQEALGLLIAKMVEYYGDNENTTFLKELLE